MKKGEKIYPTIFPLVELEDLYNAIIIEVQSKSDLKSKYLYLGWHGAKAWKSVDSSYKISAEGIQIINEYFSEIDDIIRSTAIDKRYNIVSLGSGTCEEDSKILDILFRKFSNQSVIPLFKIYIIDISIDLLNEGTLKLSKKVNNNNKLIKSVQDIISINIDIEKLYLAKNIINNHISKPNCTNLFHLLGLTLGNNNENAILNSIHNIMKIDDYLLLGVDFCADEDILLQQTKEQYHSQEITDTINEYLCSPLIFASKYEKDHRTKHIKFSNDKFEDLEIVFVKETSISNISDSISFVYYYKYKDNGATHQMRACFSNKYKSLSFKKYIEEELPRKDIHFEIVKDICSFGHKETGQYLVLLKKVYNKKSKKTNKQKNISIKEINDTVSILDRINLEILNQSVKSNVDESLIKIYNDLIKFINSNNSDENKIALVIEEIQKENARYNLKNLQTMQAIENLSKDYEC